MDELQEKKRWYILRHRYQIEKLEFFELIVKQDNACAICLKPFDFSKEINYQQACVDHDHVTGNIRGLLCRGCNFGIGYFFDSSDWIRSALTYVEKKENEMKLHTKHRAMSHSHNVLNYMKKRGPITQATASHVFGCSRLASVIHRLRKQGHKIDVMYERGIKGRFARYHLPKQKKTASRKK